jgi:hypothetical protein
MGHLLELRLKAEDVSHQQDRLAARAFGFKHKQAHKDKQLEAG